MGNIVIDYNKDLEKIKNLKVGEHCYVHWFDEGGAVVYCVNGESTIEYELFEIPQYGGEESFEMTSPSAQEVLDIAYSWT
ncbi:hypothetical protein D3C87_323640 [compost metagenome]